MAEAAAYNIDRGAQIIDINMGCPAKKVCNQWAGSALMQDEPLALAIVDAVVAACAPRNVPVTLKMRTGWCASERNALAIARAAESAGIAMVTVHGRTREQGYKGQAEYDTIAASNMPTPEQIHSILDRHRSAASPFAGSSLLSARYRDVPAFAGAWAIGHIGLPLSDRGYISILGLKLPLPEDTTFVASLRFLGALHLRIEQIAPTDAEAARAIETLTTLLVVLKSVERAQMQMHPNTAADAPSTS